MKNRKNIAALIICTLFICMYASSSRGSDTLEVKPGPTSRLAIGAPDYSNECAMANKTNLMRTIMMNLGSWRALHTQSLARNKMASCTLWVRFEVDKSGRTNDFSIDSLAGYRDDEFLNALKVNVMTMHWNYIDGSCASTFSYLLRFEKN